MAVARAPARALLLSVLSLIAVALVPSSSANHMQMDSGRIVVFDHLGGNEWWVEVSLAGQDGGQVAGVQVASYPASSTMWKAMTWNAQYGKWQASIHVPPGDPVKFRATWAGGAMQDSCWFSHPQGVEACGGPSGSPFDATFTGVRGNEWWVQANVATNGPTIASVDVRLYQNGAWGNFMPVTKQSWGWGSSYHIPQGTIVQLRATASDGQMDPSSCRQWIPPSGQDAAIVTCPGGGSPPPSAWNRKTVQALRDSWPYDLSIGDADRDGKTETYVPGDDGLYRVTASGATTISSLTGWFHVAVGDGDNDGRAEVYATRWRPDHSASELHRLSWTGSAWSDTLVYSDTNALGPITIGDVDVQGGRDVFTGRGVAGSAQVLQSTWTGSQWLTQTILDLGDDGSFLDVWGFWVANFDADANLELAVLTGGRGYSNAWVVDHGPQAPNVPSQWHTTRLESHSDVPAGITAGDADGDGKVELILPDSAGDLVLFRYASTDPYTPAYTRQDVALGNSNLWPQEAFLADGDNDGKPEVYISSYSANVYKAAFRDGSWSLANIGTLPGTDPVGGRVIVGDGDGDGKREVDVAMFDYGQLVGRVVRFTYGPAVAPTAFDATFSGVSGNQWWVQANVAGNHPLYSVEARINCGQTYKELTKQSWGGWAASFQVPNGAKVTFRATDLEGNTDVSGGYIWPNATPTTGC